MFLYLFLSSSRSSLAASTLTTSGAMGLSEKTFLNPKKMTATKEHREENVPSLDDFDNEIEIYEVRLVTSLSSSPQIDSLSPQSRIHPSIKCPIVLVLV